MARSRETSWWRGRDGGVSIPIGITFVMIASGAAAAVDFSNAFNRRAELQRAADSAALGGAARPEMSIIAIEELARTNLKKSGFDSEADILVERESGGKVSVEIDAVSPTAMLGIVGYQGVDVNAYSAAVFVPDVAGRIEVSLVLDTTQSMADDMDSLRDSAQQLVSTLFDVGGDKVKVAVVPYAAAVNIGNGAEQLAWMDTAGDAPYHGYSQAGWDITACNPTASSSSSGGSSSGAPSCTAVCDCPGTPSCGGGDDGASLTQPSAVRFAGGMWEKLVGVGAAHAGALPYANPDPSVCPLPNPPKINYFDIFDTIPNTEWMGCVEARPAPYDVTDADPNADGARTRFVPYFWPDEADWYASDASIEWDNNYVVDDEAGPNFDSTIAYFPTWSGRRRVNVYKYTNTKLADIVEGVPEIRGPNRACPNPILPLTDSRTSVTQKISTLQHRNGGGTIISEGLMWGWRSLSPGAPFSEGEEYSDEVRKIIIVLSDGANQVIARKDSTGAIGDDTMGDYTAYGFGEEFDQNWPSRGLMDTSSNTSTPYFDQVRNFLDERTATACSNIKSAGTDDYPIEIYTVLVGDSDFQTEEVLASCATTRADHYKSVSDINALDEAFTEVAEEITGKGSSRLVK